MGILISFFVIGLIFLSTPSYAAENNWIFLGEIEGDLWFVDTDSIVCKENFCKTWVKIQSRTTVNKISIDKGEYTKSLHEYNCTWREYRILQTAKYDANGNAISSVSPQESEKKHKVPEAISNTLYDLICKKSGQQKEEQQDIEKKYPEKVGGEVQKSATENHRKEKTKEPAVQSQIEQPQSQTKSVTQKIIPTEKAAIVKKETRKKSPQIEKSAEPMFTVQVGAFKNPSLAESLKTMLAKKGYTTYITTSESAKEGTLHKVCIGKFSDRKKAEHLSEEIKKTEGLQAFITSL